MQNTKPLTQAASSTRVTLNNPYFLEQQIIQYMSSLFSFNYSTTTNHTCMCQIILAFWLVHTYDQLEDVWTDDIINTLFLFLWYMDTTLLCLWPVTKMSIQCGKNISDTLSYHLKCHSFALTTFTWCHLWSNPKQMNRNMESNC